MPIILFILAIIPGLLISYYIFVQDKHEKEPHRYLITAFVFGMLSTVPAIILEEAGMSLGITEDGSIFQIFLFAFVVVAFSEELVKFLFLRLFHYNKSEFNEPFDGIVYTMMIGMGFATLENIMYAFSFGIETTILRMFTAVPAHAAFAVIMGYYVGYAKFGPKKNERINLAKGLFGAVLLHGAYDFFLFQKSWEGLMVLALVVLVVGLYLGKRMIKIHQDASPFQTFTEVADTEDSDIQDFA